MMKSIFEKRIFVVLFAFLSCALWGSAFPCIKIGYSMMGIGSSDYHSQILFAGVRFFVAGVLVILFASFSGRKLMLPRKDGYYKIAILAVFQTILQYFLFYVGMANTTGVKGSIISGCSGFVAIIFACIFLTNEKMTRWKALGCLLGFIGLVLVNLEGLELSFDMSLMGEGFLIISTISSSISSLCIKIFSRSENPVILSGYQFALGGLVLIIAGSALGGQLVIGSISCIFLIIYMAIISSVAYTLWGVLLKYNPVSKIAIFNFLIPVIGVILSGIFLKENIFSITTITALIFVCLGIYAVNRVSE